MADQQKEQAQPKANEFTRDPSVERILKRIQNLTRHLNEMCDDLKEAKV